MALDNQGAVWSWGTGEAGQLGHAVGRDDECCVRPTRLGLTGVLRIAAGAHHTLLLTGNGSVYAIGDNRLGQLGVATEGDGRWLPTPIDTLRTRVTEVSANGDRSVAVDDEGSIFEWGEIEVGPFGSGGPGCQQYRQPHILAFRDQLPPKRGGRGVRARRVFTGRSHAFAVMATGELYAWGHNAFGQLGIGPTVGRELRPQRVTALAGKRVRQASAGGRYSIVLTEAGEVYTMGFEAYVEGDEDEEEGEDSRDGVLGHETLGFEDLNVPTLVMGLVPQNEAYLKTLKLPELKREVAKYADTKGNKAVLIERLLVAHRLVLGAHDVVVEVCAGEHCCLARTADGKIFSWGANSYGQLGLRELGVGAGEHNVGDMRKYWDHEHSPKPVEAGALARPKGKAVAPWLKK